jgi:hypothetical protein
LPLPQPAVIESRTSFSTNGWNGLEPGRSRKSANHPFESVPKETPGFVTTTVSRVPAERAGETASIRDAVVTATPVAGRPPMSTAAPARKPEPMIVTAVPPPDGPEGGAIDDTRSEGVPVGVGFRVAVSVGVFVDVGGGVGVEVGSGVSVKVAVGTAVFVFVGVGVAVGGAGVAVRLGVGLFVTVGTGVREKVGVGVEVAGSGVNVLVTVFVFVGVGSRGTVYWKRSAHDEVVQAVQVAQVPLLPKISRVDPSQALTMYWTVVPPGWAGMVALATSTICPPCDRSANVQE